MALVESGSSLLYPLFVIWAREYAKVEPEIPIMVERSDSDAGIARAISGRAQIGASDVFMSDEQLAAEPGVANIPLAIAAVTVNYNLPGLNDARLKLDGPVIAGIYAGDVRFWNDPQLVKLNPGAALPHRTIIPIRRSDSSGTTEIFTQYLTYSTPSWEDGPGTGTIVEWPPVRGAIGAVENRGMVEASGRTPYSIAYVGASLHDAVERAGLGTARLGNQAGRFVLPTTQSVSEAAATLESRTPGDERLSLVYAPGDGTYPLVGYEYAVVATKQRSPQTAAAIRSFLAWVLDEYGGGAQRHLDAVRFVALPEYVRSLSLAQVEQIR